MGRVLRLLNPMHCEKLAKRLATSTIRSHLLSLQSNKRPESIPTAIHADMLDSLVLANMSS